MSIRYFCRTCKAHKPERDFYVSRKSKCKACVIAMVSNYRERNIEKIRESDRQRGFHGRQAYAAEYRQRFPERRRAHVVLGNALRNGSVTKWPVCAIWTCDQTPEAHHCDYSRPLDVVWLCAEHHKGAHTLFRRLMKKAA